MLKVIGIGDNVCDKYLHQQRMYPGGQALNFAVYAQALGAGAAFLGVFGNDAVAAHVMQTLDRHQVDRSCCRQYDGENGYARVSLVDGERVFLGSNKGGVLRDHPIELTQDDLSYLKEFSHCHTSNNSYLDSQLSRIKEAGLSLSYDFSGQWVDHERVERVAPYANFAFLSCGALPEPELQALCRDLHQKGIGMVVATRGSAGALLYDGLDFYSQPPNTVEAVDTLGAGDSFAAAFLISWLEANRELALCPGQTLYRDKLRVALQKAAAFSARTCLVYGAFGDGVACVE